MLKLAFGQGLLQHENQGFVKKGHMAFCMMSACPSERAVVVVFVVPQLLTRLNTLP